MEQINFVFSDNQKKTLKPVRLIWEANVVLKMNDVVGFSPMR